MPIKTVTPPAGYPVTLDEVKARLRIDGTDSDTDLQFLIAAATQTVEGLTWRPMVQRTVDWTLDHWRPVLVPPLHPVQSVTSITYLDTAGAEQTLDAADYRFTTGGDRGPARITPAYGKVWPSLYQVAEPITVRLVVGWAPAETDHGANVWPELKAAVLFLVGHWDKLRTPVNVGDIVRDIPTTLDVLTTPNRLQV